MTVSASALRLSKGHGTGNDFVIVEDPDGAIDLSEDLVRALCDRRTGIGGDGVLRVVRTATSPEFGAVAPGTSYFMDYRNADGSIAEMCGNGLRVFVRYLAETGRLGPEADRPESAIGTRAGTRRARIEAHGQITVDLGRPQFGPEQPRVRAESMTAAATGRTVLMPNPHVVVGLPGVGELAALDLSRTPTVLEPLPQGQNVEFVYPAGDHHLVMRVHERGAGETRSCGTGIGAVVAVHGVSGDPTPWRVDVPGGTCTVRWDDSGHLWLSGPAVIVARVEVTERWLSAATPAGITV